jgi:hypothetical protein
MQILALSMNEDLLEVHHNMLNNKDTIFINGQEVFSKRRYFATTHKFSVHARDGYSVDQYQVRISMGMNGTTFEVVKNGVCLMATSTREISLPPAQQQRPPIGQSDQAPESADYQQAKRKTPDRRGPAGLAIRMDFL